MVVDEIVVSEIRCIEARFKSQFSIQNRVATTCVNGSKHVAIDIYCFGDGATKLVKCGAIPEGILGKGGIPARPNITACHGLPNISIEIQLMLIVGFEVGVSFLNTIGVGVVSDRLEVVGTWWGRVGAVTDVNAFGHTRLELICEIRQEVGDVLVDAHLSKLIDVVDLDISETQTTRDAVTFIKVSKHHGAALLKTLIDEVVGEEAVYDIELIINVRVEGVARLVGIAKFQKVFCGEQEAFGEWFGIRKRCILCIAEVVVRFALVNDGIEGERIGISDQLPV